MAVKTKKATKETSKAAKSLGSKQTLESRIERIGELQDQIAELQVEAEKKVKPIHAKIAVARKELKELSEATKPLAAKGLPVGKGTKILATGYVAKVGKQRESRYLRDVVEVEGQEFPGLQVVHYLLGSELFYKLATMTLGNVDDYVDPQVKHLVIGVDAEGDDSRTFKVEPIEK